MMKSNTLQRLRSNVSEPATSRVRYVRFDMRVHAGQPPETPVRHIHKQSAAVARGRCTNANMRRTGR